MNASWRRLAFACLCAATQAQAQDPGPRVEARGAVDRTGVAIYAAGARLSDVVNTAHVLPGAYTLGAAWLQPSLHTDQLRLRAGIVYELGAIRRKALADANDALAEGGASFQRFIAALPVTGRRPLSVLDPARLAVSSADDRPIHDGDTLVYPTRPATIRIVGAVQRDCTLPHAALRDARRYLADCPASGAADRDAIFVIQPDGAVFEQKVALWNRDEPRPVAPGAWIYVPFDRRAVAGAAEDDFNADVAAFLATQWPDGDGWR